MENILDRTRKYFDLFDGQEHTLDAERQAIIDDFIDADKFQVITPTGPVSYNSWIESIRDELEHGCKANLKQLELLANGNIEYTVHVYTPSHGVDTTVHSIGIMDPVNHKLVRVEPMEHGERYHLFLGDPSDKK